MAQPARPTNHETTLNVPQLLVLLLIGFLIVRWIWSACTGSSGGGASSSSRSSASTAARDSTSAGPGRTVNYAQVEQVSHIFPHVPRRQIAWDLMRNGGSVARTTERVLTAGGLETPPPTFQPAFLNAPQPPAQAHTPRTPSSSSTASDPRKSSHPDLITRYNLSERVRADDVARTTGVGLEKRMDEEGKTDAWKASRSERQALLKKRRDDMILKARRKMLEADGNTAARRTGV